MNLSMGFSRRLRFIVLGAFVVAAGWVVWSGEQKVGASAMGPTTTFTGAPGEGNCTACHNDFAVNSGTGNLQITGLPANYRLGQTVRVTITVNELNAVVYGFESTAVDLLGRAGGTFSLLPISPAQTQIQPGIVGPYTRSYVLHTVEGIIPVQFGTKSWQYDWHGPTTPRGNISFYAASNAANSDGGTSGDHIYTATARTNQCIGLPDFDGDCRSDVSLFRQTDGGWYTLRSSNGTFQGTGFGAVGDIITPGDFDGDGTTDIGVYRPANGAWYALNSSNGAFTVRIFGLNGDSPVVGDFDGDHKSDLAIFRPSEGAWYLIRSSDGQFVAQPFGANGDQPVPGDYDADGKTDIAVFRPSSGGWFILRSGTNSVLGVGFGANGDRAVEGDYDGDGRTDVAVYRPSSGVWYGLLSSDSSLYVRIFGLAADLPAPGDFDGDGKTDVAVLRAGNWYIQNSGNGSINSIAFGAVGDIPVQSGYIGR
ncbi:MAG: choice-of-anchor V domain-containing protein [Pyrinomonadaceae bacterium]